LSSFVRGERGLRRYQVPLKINAQEAEQTMRRFLSGNWAIARNMNRLAEIDERFLVYLPFWTIWGRVAAWVFGEKRVGSGNNRRYEPREERVVKEMTWTSAACDVGEFGVSQVNLTDQPVEPFNAEALHDAGMVFEPVSSFTQAREDAERQFQEQVRRTAGLDRLSQVFIRLFRHRSGLVYYPLWVVRYLYRGRAFQVVVDGFSGKVLYGKAPGNTLYRAAVLVGGMAVGAFLALDASVGVLYLGSDDDIFGVAVAMFAVGLGLMYVAYRAYRYGEEYEHRSAGPKRIAGLENPFEAISQIKGVEEWIERLT
jgi:hypothetical protein